MGVRLINHPLVQHKVTFLRDKDTKPKDFRDLIEEISTLLVYEATRDLPLKVVDVETPLGISRSKIITGKKLGLIPILRAGLGMVNGIIKLIPTAKVGHLGIYRDPNTLQPVEYYSKLPEDLEERDLFILDPMLATGGSAIAGIKYLRNKGADSIKLICIIASEDGITLVEKIDPHVEIFTAAIDSQLNDHGYIIPGLGDAGDRLFGTK